MATIRNIGLAQPVAQEDTITMAGAFASGDTVSITISQQTLVVTCGATCDTTTEIASAVQECIGLAGHDPASISADATCNFGGQETGHEEFRDVVATVSGSVVTVKSVTPGQPFVMSVTETTAGSGTATETTAIAATGPEFFNNGANWEGGSVPAIASTIQLDGASSSIKYALNNVIKDYDLITMPDYSGDIGLPKINPRGYTEYRQRFFDMPNNSTPTAQTADIRGTGSLRIDYGTVIPTSITFRLHSSGPVTADGASVQIVGGQLIDLITHEGSISISEHPAETMSEIKTIKMLGAATVLVGVSATFVNVAASIEQESGTLDLYCVISGSLTQSIVRGGLHRVHTSARLTSLYVYKNGYVDYRGNSLANYSLYGGTLDCSLCPTSAWAGDLFMYKGATLIDPLHRMTADINLNGCAIQDVTLVLKDNLQFAVSAGTASLTI